MSEFPTMTYLSCEFQNTGSKGQCRFSSGLLLSEVRMGFKQTQTRESLELVVLMSMVDIISIRPLSQWRESCLCKNITSRTVLANP